MGFLTSRVQFPFPGAPHLAETWSCTESAQIGSSTPSAGCLGWLLSDPCPPPREEGTTLSASHAPTLGLCALPVLARMGESEASAATLPFAVRLCLGILAAPPSQLSYQEHTGAWLLAGRKWPRQGLGAWCDCGGQRAVPGHRHTHAQPPWQHVGRARGQDSTWQSHPSPSPPRTNSCCVPLHPET